MTRSYAPTELCIARGTLYYKGYTPTELITIDTLPLTSAMKAKQMWCLYDKPILGGRKDFIHHPFFYGKKTSL